MNNDNFQAIKELLGIANCEANSVAERVLALDRAYSATLHFSNGTEELNSHIERLGITDCSFVMWGALHAEEMILEMLGKPVSPNVIRGKSEAIMATLFPSLVKGETDE